MSFSAEQKERIITESHKNSCCRRAFLCGILASKASIDEKEIAVSLEKKEYCEFVAKLIFEFFGREPVISAPKGGGRCKLITFESKAAVKYLTSLNDITTLFVEKCQGCASAFSKGVFFACGSISNPEKQYLLELLPSQNTDLIEQFLINHSLTPRITVRNGKKGIYFKRASDIEDFCGFAGLTEAMFVITNTQIKREFLNNTNRAVNCETKNISKAVEASGRQIAAIKALIEHNLLSNLPDELEYTARLRIENESLSLLQLSKLFIPPISKSGLSHRLSKIIEIADQLLSGNS